MTEYTVRKYEDLAGCRLSSRGKDRIMAALEDYEAILWLEDWLRSEKPLGKYGGSRGLYAIDSVKAETDNAWCVAQENGPDEVWVPKSAAELYRRDSDGLAKNDRSQGRLGDWS